MQGLLLAGRYRLVESIGSGGMGRVWRAHDEVLHRAVAVKELTAALYVTESDRPVLLARTHAEARAAARINHSAVVTVHDVLEHDNRPWIVMELVEGNSLADEVKARGRVEPVEAARIGLWVLRGLRAAHAAGVLHRDVKPGNVLLAADRRVLLTDFGIAQVEGDTTITRTGEIVGSVDFLAPERVRGHDPGPASDLWALGATLYTAVEGTSPFRRTSPLTTMQAVVDEEPAEPRGAGPLGPVIQALLHKDPAARPGSEETEQMLAEAAEGRRPRAAQAHVPTQHVDTGRMTADRREGTGAVGAHSHGPAGHGAAAHGPTAHGSAAHGSTTHGSATHGSTAHGSVAHGASAPAAVGYGPSGYATDPRGPGAPGGPGAPSWTTTHVPGHQMPGAPGATLHGPPLAHPYGDGAPGAPKKRRLGRTLVLVAVLAALVGGGGALALHYTQGMGEQRGGTTTGTGGTDGKGQRKNGAVPADWVRVDDVEGFSLALPTKDWKRQVNGNQIDYTPDGGKHFVRIAVDDSPDFDNPYAHQLDLEQQLKKLRDYRRISLQSNTYRDCRGALWDFTWTALGKDTSFPGPRRAIEQTYLGRDGVEYAIYMSAPAADWDTTREQFDAILRGWRPNG
ncbi:serine/threonine-protein kinase [Streptomyces sp. NPDC002952]|uniref:serine/threonine-protein kinase n=1 Tax=Streptomyces sp. NPDC002952 TaxID=3364673 RepID=UPI0036BA61E8